MNYIITISKLIFYKSIPTNEKQYTSENIIKQTIKKVGKKKIVAIITDNAANMKAAWIILKWTYS